MIALALEGTDNCFWKRICGKARTNLVGLTKVSQNTKELQLSSELVDCFKPYDLVVWFISLDARFRKVLCE